ncbi:helix-turn-helix domain-containing protein [Mycobacterium sp. 94-17]|uniref:helix-turn-helix domain-containing protein n=1 Tax=Mycobacterium sp. 94-17 TaxID=2986147 RepID=UPI002D1EA95C|nr:helix-turn-helix domain-containing protein [Mycobacterium sp. 94-17]MEB4209712.1 helix-turn-helix domain-containing protein [Mycobacterium sp. 94-17]
MCLSHGCGSLYDGPEAVAAHGCGLHGLRYFEYSYSMTEAAFDMQDANVRDIVGGRRGGRRAEQAPNAPADPSPQELISLGRKLQAMRQQCGFSLATASEAAGISPSFLSHVENGKGDITFLKLARLVEVYGGSIHDLIPQNPPSPAGRSRVVRGDRLPALRESGNQAAMSLLAPDGHLAIRPIRTVMRPGFEEYVAGTQAEQFMYVLAGMVEFEFPDETCVLKRGDAIYVMVDEGYTIRIKGRSEAVVLNCTVPLKP